MPAPTASLPDADRRTRKDSPELSIVVPISNELESLEPLVDEIAGAISRTHNWELLLVDDGSSDGSLERMTALAKRIPEIRIIHHPQNLGQSAALASGFARVRGRIVITLDGDLQNDPADIPMLLAELDGCDVVCGVRRRRQDRWPKRAASRVANRVRNFVTGESIEDVGCSLRAYRAEVLTGLRPFDGMHRFLPTLLKLNGARVRQLPVSHRPRRFGASKYGIANRLCRSLVDLAGVVWLQHRWIDLSLAREMPTAREPAPSPSVHRHLG